MKRKNILAYEAEKPVSENYVGRPSRGNACKICCPAFLIVLNEWTKHFTASPGSLWPLCVAGHGCVPAWDHPRLGRGCRLGSNENRSCSYTWIFTSFAPRGHLATFQKGNTWVPHGLDGCHTPWLPAEMSGRRVSAARSTWTPHSRWGAVRVGGSEPVVSDIASGACAL